MHLCCGNSVAWLKIVSLVGVAILTVPLVWYFGDYKKRDKA